jgi:hypothetical protein
MTINRETEVVMFDHDLTTWAEIAKTGPTWRGPLSLLLQGVEDISADEAICEELAEAYADGIAHHDEGAGGVVTICTAARYDAIGRIG